MAHNPLIILATYWNERYLIAPSLRQIEALRPQEIIISEGCFDPRFPKHSTDGTKEIIEEFISKHPNARMVSALRPGVFQSIWLLLRGHKHLPWWTMFRPVRWKFLILSFLKVPYRRNQAMTFNYMISQCKEWKPGMWFMTYDADHYYDDDTTTKLQKIMREKNSKIDLITGKEFAFFGTFNEYTDVHDTRGFANMPHRIYSDTLIQPNRSIIRETKSRGSLFKIRDVLAKHLYTRYAKKAYAGVYFHYKINSLERQRAGYELGDRKRPNVAQYEMKNFTGKHPKIIREYFGV